MTHSVTEAGATHAQFEQKIEELEQEKFLTLGALKFLQLELKGAKQKSESLNIQVSHACEREAILIKANRTAEEWIRILTTDLNTANESLAQVRALLESLELSFRELSDELETTKLRERNAMAAIARISSERNQLRTALDRSQTALAESQEHVDNFFERPRAHVIWDILRGSNLARTAIEGEQQ